MQSAKNVRIAFKVEAAYNTAPGATNAEYLRYVPSPGLNLKSANIKSNEQRADALSTMGRKGSNTVDGTYGGEMSIRSHDTIMEAVMRTTWAVSLVITEASGEASSITTGANTIIGNTGSWIDAGIRRGDVIRLNNHSSAGNNDRNLRVTAVTDLEITVAETLTVNAVADTGFTITRGKKLVNGATPTKRTFYFEQENVDIGGSQLFGGCRWTGMKINGTPDGMATIEFTVLGASMDVAEGSASPYYTSPTAYTSTPLTFADATIRVAGEDIVVATAFELVYTINAATQPVIASRTSPDVFDNDAMLSGSFSAIRADFTNVTMFVDETEFELFILLTEPESEPKDYIAIYVPRCKYSSADAPLGGDGAMIETLPFECGAQEEVAAEGREATLMKIVTSAAA